MDSIKAFLGRVIFSGLFLIPFIPFLVWSELFFPFITTKVFVWRVIVEIIFAAWLLLAISDPEYRPKKSYILYALAALILVTGISDLFGVAPIKSFWSNFERMEGFISLLHLGMFFVVITSVFKESNWKHWWNTSLVASFLMVIYCVLQILGLKVINQGGVRVDGTFGNAIYLAVYMLFHIFIAVFYMWREWVNKGLRWVYGLLIVLQGLILYFTATRGAILGLIGGLVVVAILNLRNKESKTIRKISFSIIIGIVVLVGGFFLARNSSFVKNSPVLSRFSSLNTSELKTQGRYFVWPIAFEGFKEKPILGWGQENFSYVFQEHYKAEMYILEPWFDRAHNIFLDWLISGGIIGLLAYLSLYVSLLYIVWWRSGLTHTEKSIITGLVAAYFFHNLFVFDHLVSYILFISLLAYVSGKGSEQPLWNKSVSESKNQNVVLPVTIVALLAMLYFVNVKPFITNTSLIEGMKALQVTGDNLGAIHNFEKAYTSSTLGNYEVVEQIAANSPTILTSNISMEEKNSFYLFAKDAVLNEAKDKSIESDARYQLLAGSFLSITGNLDESLTHLNRAKELIPNKQQIYFEMASVYINQNEYVKALEILKTGYDLAPDNHIAKLSYLVGAIFNNNRTVENYLLTKLTEMEVAFDDNVVNAYHINHRDDRVIKLLNDRIKYDPVNKEIYEGYIKNLQNNA